MSSLIESTDDNGRTIYGRPVVIIADKSNVSQQGPSQLDYLDTDGRTLRAEALVIVEDRRGVPLMGVRNPDGSISLPGDAAGAVARVLGGAAVNTVVGAGPSRMQEQWNDQTAQAGVFDGAFLNRSALGWLQALYGCPLDILRNAGKTGETLEEIEARLDSPDVGILEPGYTPSNLPGVTAVQSDFLILGQCAINSLAVRDAEVAIETLKRICKKYPSRNVVVETEGNLGSSASGYPGAGNIFYARINRYNALLIPLPNEIRNLRVVNTIDIYADPASTTGQALSGVWRDNDKHIGSPAAEEVGKRYYGAMSGDLRVRTRRLASSAADVITTNAMIKQYALDPVMTGGNSTQATDAASGTGKLLAGSVYPTSRTNLACGAADVITRTRVVKSGVGIMDAGPVPGYYTVTIVDAASNGGVFTVEAPNGLMLSPGTVSVLYSDGKISFTLADGATDFAVGDYWLIYVSNGSTTTTVGTGNVGNGVMGTVTIGSNTGNGTLGSIVIRTKFDKLLGLKEAVPGDYTVVITTAATNAGTFSVTGPDGLVMKGGAVGFPYSDQGLSFLLKDGGTDFAVGDKFTIVVPPHNIVGNGWLLDSACNAGGANAFVQALGAQSNVALSGIAGMRGLCKVHVSGPGGNALVARHNLLTVETYLRQQVDATPINWWRRDGQSSTGDGAWIGSKEMTRMTPSMDFAAGAIQAHIGHYIRFAGRGACRVIVSQHTISDGK